MVIPEILFNQIKEWVLKEAKVIFLNTAEIQSNTSRVAWAEGLIRQLPENHEGRNSWLLNYGVSNEAKGMRAEYEKVDHRIEWNTHTNSLDPITELSKPLLKKQPEKDEFYRAIPNNK